LISFCIAYKSRYMLKMHFPSAWRHGCAYWKRSLGSSFSSWWLWGFVLLFSE
jgi:hypothetical protein